jgi:hypothetical protein
MSVNSAIVDEVFFFFVCGFTVNLNESGFAFSAKLNTSIHKFITSQHEKNPPITTALIRNEAGEAGRGMPNYRGILLFTQGKNNILRPGFAPSGNSVICICSHIIFTACVDKK